MSKSTQRQFLVSIGGVGQYFATKTGGNVSAATSKVWDGGAKRPDVLAAPAEADNIVIGRPYDPERDQPVVKELKPRVGEWTTTVTCTPLDRNMTPVRGVEPDVYPDALLVRVTSPETDAASGDAARFELEFAVGDYS